MNIVMVVLNDMRGDARVEREAYALSSAGHQVCVLALKAADLPAQETRDGYRIQRVADYTTVGWRNPMRKLGQLREREKAITDAGIALRPTVVHAHDTDTLVAASRIAEAVQARLVYDAHELYPDMISEHGLGGTLPVQRYWRQVERKIVPSADAVVTVSEGLAEVLHDRYGTDAVVVRNVPAIRELTSSDRLRRELGIDADDGVVLYQGVLIAGRGLTTLMRAMSAVRGAVLVVQGSGPEEARMREVAAAHGVAERVRFMGHIPQAELHDYACSADVGVVIYEATTLNNRMAAPNKLWAYRMAGLPVVASDFPGLRAAVEGDGVGLLFDPSSETSMASALNDILSDAHRRDTMAQEARRLAEQRDNWDREKAILLGLYDSLDS